MTIEQYHRLSLWSQAPMRVLLHWWQELDRARGDRASLRRCHTLAEVALTPAFNRLRIDLARFGELDSNGIARLAVVAGVLAHVTPPADEGMLEGMLVSRLPGAIARQMATPPPDGTRSPVSELRFRRLLAIPESEPEALFTTMVRLVRHLGGTSAQVDAPSLARGLFHWNQKTKQTWAFAYYEAAPKNESPR